MSQPLRGKRHEGGAIVLLSSERGRDDDDDDGSFKAESQAQFQFRSWALASEDAASLYPWD